MDCSETLKPLELVESSAGPYVVRTSLGWSIHIQGPWPKKRLGCNIKTSRIGMDFSEGMSVEEMFRKMYENDFNDPYKPGLSVEHQAWRTKVESSVNKEWSLCYRLAIL
jgi:hypothetical protein